MRLTIVGVILLLCGAWLLPVFATAKFPEQMLHDADTKHVIFCPLILLSYLCTGFKMWPEGIIQLVPLAVALFIFSPSHIYSAVLFIIFSISMRLWSAVVRFVLKELC